VGKKVKAISVHAMKAYEGVEIQLHLFIIPAFGGGEESVSRPSRFTPGERTPPVPIE